jgi:hypothetical protein
MLSDKGAARTDSRAAGPKRRLSFYKSYNRIAVNIDGRAAGYAANACRACPVRRRTASIEIFLQEENYA